MERTRIMVIGHTPDYLGMLTTALNEVHGMDRINLCTFNDPSVGVQLMNIIRPDAVIVWGGQHAMSGIPCGMLVHRIMMARSQPPTVIGTMTRDPGAGVENWIGMADSDLAGIMRLHAITPDDFRIIATEAHARQAVGEEKHRVHQA